MRAGGAVCSPGDDAPERREVERCERLGLQRRGELTASFDVPLVALGRVRTLGEERAQGDGEFLVDAGAACVGATHDVDERHETANRLLDLVAEVDASHSFGMREPAPHEDVAALVGVARRTQTVRRRGGRHMNELEALG